MWTRIDKSIIVSRSSIALRFLAAVGRIRDKWCRQLNKKTIHWNRRSKQIFLTATCMFFGGSSLFLLWLTVSQGNRTVALPQQIILPKLIPHQEPEHVTPPISPGMFKSFRQSIDSMRRSVSGQRKLDSLMARRPGLLDSIELFERRTKHFQIN